MPASINCQVCSVGCQMQRYELRRLILFYPFDLAELFIETIGAYLMLLSLLSTNNSHLTTDMTFEEAEKMVADNLHLTSAHSRLPDFPYYLKDLVIVPADADNEGKIKVYHEYLSNGQNNRDALISLGLFDKEQDVVIMGSDGKLTSPYSLEKYLEEAQYKS